MILLWYCTATSSDYVVIAFYYCAMFLLHGISLYYFSTFPMNLCWRWGAWFAEQGPGLDLIHDAFVFDPEILKLLQTEKRAASYGNSDNDPKVHDMVLRMQLSSLSFILHPSVMKRLSDSSQYGNEYMPNEVLQDLFDGILCQGRFQILLKWTFNLLTSTD